MQEGTAMRLRFGASVDGEYFGEERREEFLRRVAEGMPYTRVLTEEERNEMQSRMGERGTVWTEEESAALVRTVESEEN